MGLMAFLPVLVIIIGNAHGGTQQISQGFAAYSLAQKTPAMVLFPLIGLMVCGGVWAVIALIPIDDTGPVGDHKLPGHESNAE